MNKKVTIKQAIDTFPIYLYRNKKSKNTNDAYMTDINYFYNDFIKIKLNNKIRYAANITQIEILQYKDYLLDNKDFKRVTVDRKYNALKTFFAHLQEDYQIQNFIKGDKFSNKKTGDEKGKNFLPEVLKKRDIILILNTIKNSTDKDKYMAYAIFQLLINFGMRRSEIFQLRWRDIDFYDDEITICRQKTCNADVLDINDALKKALLDYRDSLSRLEEKVFITDKSDHLTNGSFKKIIDKYVKYSGLEIEKGFRITSHTFRHTFITLCIKQDMSLEKIVKFTGHKDKNTLSIYSHLKSGDVKDVTKYFNSFVAV